MEASSLRIMISDIITDIFLLSTRNVQDNGAEIAECAAAPNGKHNNPEGSKVATRYDSRLPLSIITFRT
jgi:hypothetical protein